jgi:hypothetical protein
MGIGSRRGRRDLLVIILLDFDFDIFIIVLILWLLSIGGDRVWFKELDKNGMRYVR